MPGRLWIDVEDLFGYARSHTRPSGIQRLAFEIYRALHAGDATSGRVHFVRHAPVSNGFRVVSWSELALLFAALTDGEVPSAQAPEPARRRGPARQLARTLVHRVPTSMRPDVIDLLVAASGAAQASARLLRTTMRGIADAPALLLNRSAIAARNGQAATDAGGEAGQPAFATAVRPGDVILVLGAPWSHPDYAGLIRAHSEKHGLRVAMLVYDLIPLRRPEWFDSGLVPLFRTWIDTMLPVCHHVFAISRATAADLESYAAQRGIPLPGPVVPLPLGTGLPAVTAHRGEVSGRALPPPGSYALIVATIEVRKNHLLLFRVWRRLLEELPEGEVPTLVFAGRVGWLVGDLLQQIANTRNLDGKLVIVENPTDTELARLYDGCLFTLFPSFYEGWGLPVTESLALGKPCLMSNRTSLPEAGGTLARSFDPDNLHDAYTAIRAVVTDRAGLARWEAQIRREFRPVPWSATVDALLAALDPPAEARPARPALADGRVRV